MRPARLLSLIPLGVVAACIALSVVIPLQGRNDDKVEEDLRRAAEATAAAPVALDWRPREFLLYERLIAFGTAATDEGVRRRLGFAWGEGVAVIPPHPGETILVFAGRRRVVAWTRVDHDLVDASCLAALRSIERLDARLVAVAPAEGGTPLLRPRDPVRGRRQQRRLERCLSLRGGEPPA
jgi:hypothetical protein